MNNRLIFISYNQEDEKWKALLMKHLGVLEFEGAYEVWDKSKIEAGQDKLKEINEALQNASVAILLVSIDFLNQELKVEIGETLKRRITEGRFKVVPIIISDCAYKGIKWLANMEVRPKDGTLDQKRKAQVATELKNIVLEVIKLLTPEQGAEGQGEPRPERARESPQKPVAVEPVKEPDRWESLEAEAASNPETRKRIADIASRLKSKGQPTSGSVTFYSEGLIQSAGTSSQLSGGGFEPPAGGEGNGNQGPA